MTTFYICRHGETFNNKVSRLSGWIDTPLTDEGISNAVSSAKKLHGIRFDRIISSDLGRAFITAYIISREIGYSSEIQRDSQLREVNYGDLANAGYDSYPEVAPSENADLIHTNGESLNQMKLRVMAAIGSVSSNSPGKTVLLVAHDGTINAVRSSFTEQNIGEIDAASQNPHDFVGKFVFDNDKVESFEQVG